METICNRSVKIEKYSLSHKAIVMFHNFADNQNEVYDFKANVNKQLKGNIIIEKCGEKDNGIF